MHPGCPAISRIRDLPHSQSATLHATARTLACTQPPILCATPRVRRPGGAAVFGVEYCDSANFDGNNLRPQCVCPLANAFKSPASVSGPGVTLNWLIKDMYLSKVRCHVCLLTTTGTAAATDGSMNHSCAPRASVTQAHHPGSIDALPMLPCDPAPMPPPQVGLDCRAYCSPAPGSNCTAPANGSPSSCVQNTPANLCPSYFTV